MDPITQELTSLILKTDVTRRPDLAEAGRRAFADYLASALAGSREEAVRRTAAFLATRKGERDILGFDVRTTPENAAFFNGFASHYLDFDDAEANLMGHFSTVIFSALLAIADPSDTFEDFLAGYTAGAETEGLLGKLVNPAHKKTRLPSDSHDRPHRSRRCHCPFPPPSLERSERTPFPGRNGIRGPRP